MKRISTIKQALITMGFVLASMYSVKAQTVSIYTENFDADSTALPTGWTSTTGGWSVKKTNPSTGYTGASGNVNAVIDNTASTTGIYDLVSKPISTTGYSSIIVDWGARVTTHFLDSGSVIQGFYWSNNAGSTWNQVTYTENPNNSTWSLDNGGTAIALPAGASNQSTIQLKWTANLHHSSSGTYRIDDVTVQGMNQVGIDEIQATSNIKVYSFNKTLFIQLNNSVELNGDLKIYSLNGTEIYGKSLNNEQNHKIDLGDLASGMYLIKIQNSNNIITKKVILN